VSYRDPVDHLILNIDPQYLVAALGESPRQRTVELEIREEFRDQQLERLLYALQKDLDEGCPTGSLYAESVVNAI
jgi:hypothetical protein